ncbi:MAG: deoxynucleoside kinase [Proteobacteria bacterium]|nr:deoxynucleoside kinase [Pseudomonadota bacterium]MBQ9243108.1 deoxynucleoside kinase [Pseudomonadota bacterium]
MSSYVVVEGLIGVGKTSLCKLLQARYGARLVLEQCEANPFLANFYADPEHYAFPAQMFYLASRYQQQIDLLQKNLFDEMTVADYLFEKDRIFAEQTLNDYEMELYNRFTELLSHHVSVPNFILFLDAPTDVVLDRIARRSIASEQVIEASYLDALRRRYYSLWEHWTRCPVYVLDTTMLNYVDNQDDADFMCRLVEGYIKHDPIPEAPRPYQQTSGQRLLFQL